MRKSLSILLLCCSAFCFAQNRIEYANFIQSDTTVKWAAVYTSYVNLTPVNPNFSIRNFYVNKLKQQGATAYTEGENAFAVTSSKIDYSKYVEGMKKVDYVPSKMNWWFRFDDKKNAIETIFTEESNDCDTCMVKNMVSFFKVKQLLYYKNNQFSIQNILLSPVIYQKEKHTFKENATYFETSNFAFNEIKSADVAIPATAKLIGRSCNNLVLLPSPDATAENKILTLSDWNLSHIFYHDIKQKKIQAYSTNKSIYPDSKSILDSRKIEAYENTTMEVPMYDSLGELTGYKKVIPEVNFDSIYNFTLVQDFYFDFTNEKLYSKLIALVPRLPVFTGSGILVGYRDYWGVIFPKEKLKAIKKKK